MSNMEPVGRTLKSNTVNSKERFISTVNSRNSLTVGEKIEALIEEEGITPEGVGKTLAEGLGDEKSEKYYTLLAKENPQGKLFEALSLTKDASHRMTVRSKPKYFLQILRNWGLKVKFKKA